MLVREAAAMVVLALALSPPSRAAADERDALAGTWGLPPIDGKPGLTGSYFSLYRNEQGAVRARFSLNPSGWSCGADVDVTWNAGRRVSSGPTGRSSGRQRPVGSRPRR